MQSSTRALNSKEMRPLASNQKVNPPTPLRHSLSRVPPFPHPFPHLPSSTDRMKDETTPSIPAVPSTPPRFTHSHPRPRDPADPTVRPYPRGRPRTPKVIDASSLSFKEAAVREVALMQVEEKGEGVEDEEVKVDGARSRVVRRMKEEVMGDSEVEEVNGEVSYEGYVGKPARVRRSAIIAAKKRHRSMSRGRQEREGGGLTGELASHQRAGVQLDLSCHIA